MTGRPPTTRRDVGFSKGVHDYYARYIDNSDAKIGALLTLNVAVGGLVLANLPAACDARVAAWIAVSFHGAAVSAAMYGIFPRLGSPGQSLIFWEDVRRRETATAYRRELEGLTEEQVEDAYAENNWYVARILHAKFLGIRLSLTATGVALAAAAASSLLS